jgi:cytochrome c oxidase subunit 2
VIVSRSPARLTVLAVLLVAGCGGPQSALSPAGPGAARIAGQWWLLLAVATVLYAATMAALLVAVLRRRPPPPERDAGLARWIVVGGGAVPAAIVVALLATTAGDHLSLGAGTGAGGPLRVQVIGHQWWWEIRYPEHGVVTANELHVPVGRTVEVALSTTDVIHSFWVPALEGKRDMIPGRANPLRLEAARPGVYRGQCAEYCGWQHARMAFLVVAETPERFADWLAAQRAAAADPVEPTRQAGRDAFVGFCGSCHTVRGTAAAGRFGPDLTHVGGRRTLAAGLLPNTPETLAAWIADPQALKPGNKMPALGLAGDRVAALAAYLTGLH